MFLLGYTKERPSEPFVCDICGQTIQASKACMVRASDGKRMCFKCYISECRKSHSDRNKCHCRTCSFSNQELCDKSKLVSENKALHKKVDKYEKADKERKKQIEDEESSFNRNGFVYPSAYHYMKSGVCSVMACHNADEDCKGCQFTVLRAYAARDINEIRKLRDENKVLVERIKELTEKEKETGGDENV